MEIAIAARGWQGSEWDNYYPEDLPSEWRLDYYANEFFAVLVPYAQWRALGDDVLLDWQEQVSDDYCFFWEVDAADTAMIERLQRLRKEEEFAAHWGGVVDTAKGALQPQSPFADEALALLNLLQPMALRPLREQMEQAMTPDADRLLVVVAAEAAESLRSARDLAQLLGGS